MIHERIEQTDTGQIALYQFCVEIEGEPYGGQIPAKSMADAQEKVTKFGATATGRIVEMKIEE